jgi:hypothetical protein
VELIESVRVERDVEESFWVNALLKLVVDELFQERGFADAMWTDQSNNSSVFELCRVFVWPCEVIEVAFLPIGQISPECLFPLLPPWVVIGERPDQCVLDVVTGHGYSTQP